MLTAYDLSHSGRVHTIGTGSDCKLLLWDLQSERHPAITLYLTPPPEGEHIWANWIPAIVIEVVSPSSAARDCDQKPDEYLQFGVTEYWIVDAAKEEVLILRRSGGRWAKTALRSDATYKTRLLPAFELDIAALFAAARAA